MAKNPSTKTNVKKPQPKQLPDPTQEEAEAAFEDWQDEMLGDDADYFRAAGIDDIGNK